MRKVNIQIQDKYKGDKKKKNRGETSRGYWAFWDSCGWSGWSSDEAASL